MAFAMEPPISPSPIKPMVSGCFMEWFVPFCNINVIFRETSDPGSIHSTIGRNGCQRFYALKCKNIKIVNRECSYRGVSQGHSHTIVQVQVESDLLEL